MASSSETALYISTGSGGDDPWVFLLKILIPVFVVLSIFASIANRTAGNVVASIGLIFVGISLIVRPQAWIELAMEFWGWVDETRRQR